MNIEKFLKKQQWVQILTRDIPFIRLFMVYEAYSQRFKKDIGMNYPTGIGVLNKGIFNIYRSKQRLIKFGNDFMALENKIRFFEDIWGKLRARKKEVEKSIVICEKKLKRSRQDDFKTLIECFEATHQSLKIFWSLQWSPLAIEFSLNTINRQDILQKYKKYFVGIREESQHTTVALEDLLDDILRMIARVKKLPKDLIFYATPSEILENKIIKKNLIARKKSSILGAEGPTVIMFVGKKAREIAKYIVSSEEKKKTDLIRGSPAYGGKIKGRVRVLFFRRDLKNLKKDEILVTPMTEAFYTPYLKKVKAIVIDEGGITCHAAIISREMKIPCVIGARVATKVLKTGDIIEVDADKGFIRVI